ncbi:hypothetical protein FOMPIDRAFT_84852 [Fomitopsis schrenkii]|uniref:Uncharacterized protein n=1 Tax=Fomitopsis schrenkii TaxID=2126942 RepID=S8E9A8_FOMSC|nr:hypothetical protein FOMPIDRAFT_84852 [Fomitopsis schrenkii]
MHYNDPSALQNTPWSVSLLPTLNSSVMLCVRLVFLKRVHKYYRDKIQNPSALAAVTVVVVLLSFADLGFAAAVTGELFRFTNADLTDTHTLRASDILPPFASQLHAQSAS